MTTATRSQLKCEVEKLAAEAFYRHLISGYGDGEYPDEYQIAIDGKPRHYALEDAYSLLAGLMGHLSSFGANSL